MSARPQKNSFANRVRVAAREVQAEKGHFTAWDLKDRVEDGREKKRIVQSTIWDLRRAGEVIVLKGERGKYQYIGKPGPRLKQDVMWRFLRMQRSVSAEDLKVACDVTLGYAQEYLAGLEKLGQVCRSTNISKGEVFTLIKDQVEPPKYDGKAQKLRELRARKKEKLALALKRATIAISEAIRFIEDECE